MKPKQLCYKWMVNAWRCLCVPSLRRTSSIDLDHLHRSYHFLQRILWFFHKCRRLGGTQTLRNWNNLANWRLVRQRIPHDRTIHRSFSQPKNKYDIKLKISSWTTTMSTTTSKKYRNKIHTKVSASKNTHFSNWTSLQQCSFVNVIPNSGRANKAKLAESFESKMSTSWTTLKTSFNLFLMASETPGVTNTANWWAVCTLFNELAKTNAPREYVSFVVNVTHANSGKETRKNINLISFCNYILIYFFFCCKGFSFFLYSKWSMQRFWRDVFRFSILCFYFSQEKKTNYKWVIE